VKNLKPCISRNRRWRNGGLWTVEATGPSGVVVASWIGDSHASGEGETWDEPLTGDFWPRTHFNVRSHKLNTRCVS
jgi:hypothetical protein